MNYIDYLIGLGAGVVITLILRAVSDARREKINKDLEEKATIKNRIKSNQDRIETLTEHLDARIFEVEKKTVEIDMRIDKLEAKKK